MATRLIPAGATLGEVIHCGDNYIFAKSGSAVRRFSYGSANADTYTQVFNFTSVSADAVSIQSLYKTAAGSWLCQCRRTGDLDSLYRCTDIDANPQVWVKVLDFGSYPGEDYDPVSQLPNRGTLGRNGLDSYGNTVWAGEYRTDFNEPQAVIWRSTDDGQNWSVMWAYNTTDIRLKHNHAVRYDSVTDRLILTFGDGAAVSNERRPMILTAAADFDFSTIENATGETIAANESLQVLLDEQRYRGISPVYNPLDGYWYDYVDSTDFGADQCGIFKFKSDDLVGTFAKAYDVPERQLGGGGANGAVGFRHSNGELIFTPFQYPTSTDLSIYFHVLGTDGQWATVARFSVWSGSAISGAGEWLSHIQEGADGNIYLSGNASVNAAGHNRTRVVRPEGRWVDSLGYEEIGSVFWLSPDGSDLANGETQIRAFATLEYALSLGLPFGSRIMSLGSINEAGGFVSSNDNDQRPTSGSRGYTVTATEGGFVAKVGPYLPPETGLIYQNFSGLDVMPYFGLYSSNPNTELTIAGSMAENRARTCRTTRILTNCPAYARVTSVGVAARNQQANPYLANFAVYECDANGFPGARVGITTSDVSIPTGTGTTTNFSASVSWDLEEGNNYIVVIEPEQNGNGANFAIARGDGVAGAGTTYDQSDLGVGSNMIDPWVSTSEVDQDHAVWALYEIVLPATYYIATTGDNADSGGSDQPWATLAYAATQMSVDDVLIAQDSGTYGDIYVKAGYRFRMTANGLELSGSPASSGAPASGTGISEDLKKLAASDADVINLTGIRVDVHSAGTAPRVHRLSVDDATTDAAGVLELDYDAIGTVGDTVALSIKLPDGRTVHADTTVKTLVP